MRNHDQKIKDMQRSVLPSTARGFARAERRLIHKRARARARDALAEARKIVNTDIRTDPDPDFREGRRKAATHWMVLDRRAADKIGPLCRWAVRTVEADEALRDAPLHDQAAFFAALMPKDLIGEHAVFHIRWALRWEFHRDDLRLWDPSAGSSRVERREQVASDARQILATGRHRELNVELRRLYGAGDPPRRTRSLEGSAPARLLLGLHDVESFAGDISRHPSACEVVSRVAGA